MINVMTIAAMDNSGGAGIIQDAKVATKLDCWALAVVTGITIQNFDGLDAIYPLPLEQVEQQFCKNIKSFQVNAIKIGALCSPDIACLIAFLIKKYPDIPVIVDPVLSPTNGKRFISEEEIKCYEEIFYYTDILTPNRHELEVITGNRISSMEDADIAAQKIVDKYGCKVYVKGGHFSEGLPHIEEHLVTKDKKYVFFKDKVDMTYSHGTGCRFSTALACFLAKGYSLEMTSELATDEVSQFYEKINKQI